METENAAREGASKTPSTPSLSYRVLFLIVNFVQAWFFGFWTAFCVTTALLALPLSRRIPLILARRMWAPPLLYLAGAKLQVSGLHNVCRGQPQVFVSNHQSMMDIAVVFRVLPENLHFVMKKELLYAPFVGFFAWATGMIFVDRKNSKAAVASLQRVGRLVREGRTIMAFPEGTRSRGQGVLPFKKGVFVSAIAAQVPVVPLAIEGADRVLPSSSFAVRPGVIRVNIGAPIPTAGLAEADKDALRAQAQAAVHQLYADIRLPAAS